MTEEWSQFDTKQKAKLLLEDTKKEYLRKRCHEKARSLRGKIIDTLIKGYHPIFEVCLYLVKQIHKKSTKMIMDASEEKHVVDKVE